VKFARARLFVKAVAAHNLDAAEELLDPDVETVTPREPSWHPGVPASASEGERRRTIRHGTGGA
jgi:hypothetical protein